MRDYVLLENLSRLDDDFLVGPNEVAAILDVSAKSVQQRAVRNLPVPVGFTRHLRWRLGAIRQMTRNS